MNMSLKVVSKRKGIGELLAVIIVIAITIVAGLLVYSIVMGKVSLFGNSPGLQIENAQFSNGVLTLSVKNTGSYTFSAVTVQVIYNGQAQTITPLGSSSGGSDQETLAINLQPGQSASQTYTLSETVGGTYTVIVQGQYGSGASFTVSTNVVAS